MHYNLLNECMSCEMSSTNPSVGMCATMFVGSDRYAMVVTEVINKKKIRVDHMVDEDYNGEKHSDQNGADFVPIFNMNKYARVNDEHTGFESTGQIYTYRKNKRWMREGDDCWGTRSIHLGKADNYMDPSF